MIYLDNAATTYPKPRAVTESVCRSFSEYGANPGRAGHDMAMRTSAQIYNCREKAAEFFGMSAPENVIFTPNCTTAVNIVLKGFLKYGDHVVVSDLEHNAVMRPLFELMKTRGIKYTAAHVCENNDDETVLNFKKSLNENTKLIFCSHASNVFGLVLPIKRLSQLAHRNNILFGVDAAQSAGVLPINMIEDEIDFLCVPGHKGLYGPMGTGMLLLKNDIPLRSFVDGGTGSLSAKLSQPDFLPDRFESGTGNTSGIIGLSSGISFVKGQGLRQIYEHEMTLMRFAYLELQKVDGIILYTGNPKFGSHVPLISFNINEMHSEETAKFLCDDEIAVRAGLHCAPCAHSAFGTLQSGTVRVCPSIYTCKSDIKHLIKSIGKIANQAKI